MGACVLVCGKSSEAIQDYDKRSQIQKEMAQQMSNQLEKYPQKDDPIIQEQIQIDVKVTEMCSSVTKSWKTQTRSRFYKQKPLQLPNESPQQKNYAINVPSQYTQGMHKIGISHEFYSEDSNAYKGNQSTIETIKQNQEDQSQFEQFQSIKFSRKKKMRLHKEAISKAHKLLIQSTRNNCINTLINEQIKYIDGSTYSGQWKNSMRHGHGKLQWGDGTHYEGQWRANMTEGLGTLVYSDGQSYSGSFQKNQAQGNGEYYFSNGSKYIGQWHNNLPEGHGSEIFADGQKYVGSWSKGKKNGYGQFYFKDGSHYKGQFFNNEFQGKGQYNYCQKLYIGNWEHNQKSGKGRMEWADGKRYQGDFFHDKMHGSGKFFHKDGSILQGNWTNGRKEGVFVEYRPNGEIVKAQMSFNKILRIIEKISTQC